MQRFILLIGLVASAFAAPVKQVAVPEKPNVKLPVPNLHAAPKAEKPAVKVAAVKVAPVLEKPAVKVTAPVAAKAAVKAAAVQSKHVVPVPEKTTAKLPVPNLHAKVVVAVAEKPAVKQPVKAVPAAAKAVPVPEKPVAKLPVPNLHAKAGVEAAEARGLAEPVSCKRLEACLAQGAGLAEDTEKTKLKTCIQSFCEDMRSQGKNVSNSRVCDAKGKEVMDIIAMATKDKKKASLVAVFHTLVAQGTDVKHVTDACRLQSSTFLKAAAVQKHADVPKLPEQGYGGKGVRHENMKSITADFGAEYGPTTQPPIHSGAQGSAFAVAVAVAVIAASL